MFAARGLAQRYRHLMTDVRTLLPHSKAEPKKERKDDLKVINEVSLILFVSIYSCHTVYDNLSFL